MNRLALPPTSRLDGLQNSAEPRPPGDSVLAECSTGLHVRPAKPQDAEGIANLYRIAYMVRDPGDAPRHYPFPVFMQAPWLRTAMVASEFTWWVAHIDQHVIGAVVGIRNIGDGRKASAEVCGLVIHPQYRRLGAATQLLSALHTELSKNTDLVFAETRTAEAGAWRLFRKFGYLPLGFEPAAHRTPLGFEPMLVQCLFLNKRGPDVQPGSIGTREVQSLRAAVAGVPCGDGLTPRCERSARPSDQPATPALPVLAQATLGVRIKADITYGVTRILEAYFRQQHSHTLPFSFYDGSEHAEGRINRQYFLALDGDRPIALAKVVFDCIDRRARITSFRTTADAPPLMAQLVATVLAHGDAGPMSVVLDIYATNLALQTELQRCGFFPTVYYPDVAYQDNSPVDGVQMVYLHQFDMKENLIWGRQVDWPRARDVIEQIAEFSRSRVTA